MSDQILDLRTLADEWNSAVEDLNETTDNSASYGELADIESRYWELCDELGIEDKSPDGLRNYGDSYEPTLIREDYFTEYAQELADDICPFPSSSPEAELLNQWPYRHIDWDAAARELKYDYTSVTFDGDDYYIRSC